MTIDGRSDTHKIIETIPWGKDILEKKGWRGTVQKARTSEGIVCIKSPRGKIKDAGLLNEWDALRKANKKGVGPKAIEFLEGKLMMGFAEGKEFKEWIETAGAEDIRKAVPEILRQGRELDKIGLDHGQLSWAPKHIIIGKKITLIDFDRASDKRQANNLTSLIGFLMLNPKGEWAGKIRAALGIEEGKIGEIKEILKEYRKKKAEKEYKRIMEFVA